MRTASLLIAIAVFACWIGCDSSAFDRPPDKLQLSPKLKAEIMKTVGPGHRPFDFSLYGEKLKPFAVTDDDRIFVRWLDEFNQVGFSGPTGPYLTEKVKTELNERHQKYEQIRRKIVEALNANGIATT